MNHVDILRPLTRVRKITCVVATATLMCVVLALAAIQASESAQAADCSGSLQSKIDAAPDGATVTADPCIYREQVNITKPLTLEGQPGSEIRGSEVWTSWTASGDNFASTNTLRKFYQEDVSCQVGTQRCAWPEQVFMDGQPLRQVSSGTNPASGEFKMSSTRKVVLGSAPTGKTVEVTVRKHWTTGVTRADGVTIRGFTMKHAANDWRCGALQSRGESTGSGSTFSSCRQSGGGDDWNLINNTLLHASGAVVSLRSSDVNIEGNEIAYGGQLGIHNPRDNSLISGNEIHHNNTEAFCRESQKCVGYSTDGNSTATNGDLVESGGIKVADGQAFVTVSNNEVYANDGHGIWFDVGARDITILGNRIHHNARHGVFFEISDRAQIYDNTLWENGWATPETVNGAGIEIGNSDDAEVYENTLAWNADGIAVRCLSRGTSEQSTCQNADIHHNTILQEEIPLVTSDTAPAFALAWVGPGGSGSLYASANGNSGYSNEYWYAKNEDGYKRFVYNTKYASVAGFNTTLGEENGSYLTTVEKDLVTTSENIPANPEQPR